jgi:hypothetical protein
MKITRLIPLLGIAMLAACITPSSTAVRGPNGQRRSVPNPQKFVQFQGSEVTIKGVTVKVADTSNVTTDASGTKKSGTAPAAAENKGAKKSGSVGDPSLEGGIGEITFGKKFREATDLAVILDNAQFRDAQNLIAAASVLSDAEFTSRLASIADAQQKLDQLALIASTRDSIALQKWIDIYFDARRGQLRPAAQQPITNTAIGLKQF